MATAKGEATKARIVDAAADLLVAGGADNLSLDDVLEATRTSKGQLFHYFPDGKRGLHAAATARQVERVAQASAPPVLTTWEDWERWFDRIIVLHEQQSEADACEVAALAGRALDTSGPERQLIGSALENWRMQVASRLRDLQSLDLLRRDAPVDELASMILSAIEGGAVVDKATRSTRHLTAALRQTLGLLRSFG